MGFGKPKTPLTPEEQVERNRRRAIGLSVAAEAFKQGDPVGRAIGLQQQFEQQAQQAEQEAQTQSMLASMTPEQRAIYNMQKMGLPESYIKSKLYPAQEKKGTQRYTVYDRETGTPIRSISAYDQEAINAAENNPKELIGSFAGLSEDKPSKVTKSDFVVDILSKITSHVPTAENPTYKLTPQDLQVLDTISNTDPIKQLIRNLQMGYANTPVTEVNTPVPEANTETPVVKDGQDPKYANLKDGDAFKIEGDETIYYKNQ